MKKNLLLNYFPIPDFLKIPSAGIDISDGSIRFVEIVEIQGEKRLGRFGKIKLPAGILKRGEIINRQKLIEILNSIKKEYKFNFLRVSVAENNSYIFKTNISKTENMPREEILARLRFKLEENVPIKPEEAVFDFDIISADKDNLNLVVSVLPKKIIDSFISVFEEVGIKILSFEIEGQALARSLIPKGDKGNFMIVDFRNTRIGISIVRDEIVHFTSTLDIGENDLISSIEKTLGINKEVAEKIKNERGFIKQSSKDEVFFAMLKTASLLKEEINKYLIYWHNHKDNKNQNNKENKIKKIILCGVGGKIKGIDDYLSLALKIKVEKANAWTNIFSLEDYIPPMTFLESLEFSSAIGLGTIEDNKIINYNKVEIKK